MLQLLQISVSDIQLQKLNNFTQADKEIYALKDQKEVLMSKNKQSNSYLTIMLKIYNQGKFTPLLRKENFKGNNNIKLSVPLGKGLELS